MKTTTLNFEMFLFRMFFKHYCKGELEAKFGAKFFSRLAILQPVKLVFDCHWYFDTGSENIWVFFFVWGISFAFIQAQRVHFEPQPCESISTFTFYPPQIYAY